MSYSLYYKTYDRIYLQLSMNYIGGLELQRAYIRSIAKYGSTGVRLPILLAVS